jgi:hypothetical protein
VVEDDGKFGGAVSVLERADLDQEGLGIVQATAAQKLEQPMIPVLSITPFSGSKGLAAQTPEVSNFGSLIQVTS